MNDSQVVWVLIVEHRHGQNVSVWYTEQDAVDELAAYVAEWWEETGLADIPDDDRLAIDDYFDAVSGEYYSIEQTTLMTRAGKK